MTTQIPVKGLWEFVGKANAIEFAELYPATNLIPAAPRFIFGTFAADLAAQYFGNTHLWAMGLYKLRGFDVFGPYALCKDGQLYCSHEANIHSQHVIDVVTQLGPPNFPRPRRFLTGQVAMITGPGHKVYGHWLSDFLPKLYLLQAGGHDVQRLHYLLPVDTPAFGRAWLDLLGIPPENIIFFNPRGELVWVEELLLPTTFHNGVRASVLLNEAAKFLVSLVESRAGAVVRGNSGRRMFVSRARASQSRPLGNRDQIEAIAVNAGLELVHPEALSLVDQVRLFGEASMLVGEYGSALHGSLFSPPGTTVCAMRGPLSHPGFIQSGFGHALRQPTGYVFGEMDDLAGDGRFAVSEQAFAECLAVLLRSSGFE